jgi:hypothetical protein
MVNAGNPQKQAVAAALDTARRSARASGGLIKAAPGQPASPGFSKRTPSPNDDQSGTRSDNQFFASGGASEKPEVGGGKPLEFPDIPKMTLAKGRGGPTVNPPAIAHVPWRVKSQPTNVTGPLIGTTPGRADKLPMSVPNGSHVLPADTVAALGDGNSMAGHHVLKNMFPHSGGSSSGSPFPGSSDKMGHPMGRRGAKPSAFGRGGASFESLGGHPHQVDVNVSHGEFIIHPHDVARVGGGDIKKGHAALDKFILKVRDHYQKKLKRLPGPSK